MIDCSGDPSDCVGSLIHVLTFCHPLCPNLSQQEVQHVTLRCSPLSSASQTPSSDHQHPPLSVPPPETVSTLEFIPIHLSEVVVSVRLALLLPAFLLEFHLTHRHDSRCQLRIILTTLISSAQPHLVAIPLLRFRKSDDIKSIVRELKLLIVINGVNLIKA